MLWTVAPPPELALHFCNWWWAVAGSVELCWIYRISKSQKREMITRRVPGGWRMAFGLRKGAFLLRVSSAREGWWRTKKQVQQMEMDAYLHELRSVNYRIPWLLDHPPMAGSLTPIGHAPHFFFRPSGHPCGSRGPWESTCPPEQAPPATNPNSSFLGHVEVGFWQIPTCPKKSWQIPAIPYIFAQERVGGKMDAVDQIESFGWLLAWTTSFSLVLFCFSFAEALLSPQ